MNVHLLIQSWEVQPTGETTNNKLRQFNLEETLHDSWRSTTYRCASSFWASLFLQKNKSQRVTCNTSLGWEVKSFCEAAKRIDPRFAHQRRQHPSHHPRKRLWWICSGWTTPNNCTHTQYASWDQGSVMDFPPPKCSWPPPKCMEGPGQQR